MCDGHWISDRLRKDCEVNEDVQPSESVTSTAETAASEEAVAATSESTAPAKDAIYEDANGWKVTYNSERFEINKKDNIVTFVYMGESTGTNMITVTYDVDKTAKEAVDEIAASWGSDTVIRNEGTFPGADNVNGFFATLPPASDGSGLYETAVARDYMGGYLMFELTGHNSGDDELDMEVGDQLAAVIDSLEFPYEN